MTAYTLATFERCRVLAGEALAKAQALTPIGDAGPVDPPRPGQSKSPRILARPDDDVDGLTAHAQRLAAAMPPALWDRLRLTLARIDRGPPPRGL